MKTRSRLSLAITALALAASVSVAAPAAADHIAEVYPGGCRIGGLVTGSYETFSTTNYTHLTNKKGETVGFICRFKDLPEVVYDYDGVTPWWQLPEEAITWDTRACTKPEEELPNVYNIGRWHVTPSGNATLRCMFDVAERQGRG